MASLFFIVILGRAAHVKSGITVTGRHQTLAPFWLVVHLLIFITHCIQVGDMNVQAVLPLSSLQ